jgi:hypothetical protein
VGITREHREKAQAKNMRVREVYEESLAKERASLIGNFIDEAISSMKEEGLPN